MGQEKSLPSRCNSVQDYHSSTSNSSVSTTTRSIASTSTSSSRYSCKSVERQTKYLKEQLYIKSYLDIEEQDRNAKKQFTPATRTNGIRNYRPKILGEKPPTPAQQDVDVWI
ncbi:Glucose-methanol-choline oxidoreductase [Sergentomyia squamirostris]